MAFMEFEFLIQTSSSVQPNCLLRKHIALPGNVRDAVWTESVRGHGTLKGVLGAGLSTRSSSGTLHPFWVILTYILHLAQYPQDSNGDARVNGMECHVQVSLGSVGLKPIDRLGWGLSTNPAPQISSRP